MFVIKKEKIEEKEVARGTVTDKTTPRKESNDNKELNLKRVLGKVRHFSSICLELRMKTLDDTSRLLQPQ